MKSFDDLKFTYDDSIRRWSASLTLDNGYSFSVIAGDISDEWSSPYGVYQNDTFEVAVFNSDGDWVPLSAYDDVLGWQSPSQLSLLMRQFSMDGKAHEDLLVAMREEYKKEFA